MILRRQLLLLALLMLPVFMMAQPAKYTSTSKAAINSFEKGLDYYNSKDLPEAEKSMLTAVSRDATFIEAWMVLGDIRTELRNPEGAIEAYSNAIGISPTFFPNNFYHLARNEFKLARYEDALRHYQQFIGLQQGKTSQLTSRAEQGIRHCQFALTALKDPKPFQPVNLGRGLNSVLPEYYPSFTVDQREIIFTRDLPLGESPGRSQEDFYWSTLRDSVWTEARPVNTPLNSALNEGAPSLSADGRALFFTACERPEGQGSCDIYLSQRTAEGGWTKPLNLGPPINTSAWESQPSFSSDGKTLYFIRGVYDSNRKAQQDIYYSVFGENMQWSEPLRLNDSVNTQGKEESVFIHPDNQTLYFASDYHPGMGGLDLFVSRKKEDGSWSTPMNLGYPINTAADENSFVVSADGRYAYFASDRQEGYGNLDLYRFELYKEAQPVLVNYVKAIVVDDANGNPLSASFEVLDVQSGKLILKNSTDKRKGEFLASLPAGKEYMLNVSKSGYLFYSDHFSLTGESLGQQAFERKIRLKPIKSGSQVVLRNVFFDTDKADLKSQSYSELDRLATFLKDNPSVRVEISGHTDSRGNKTANMELSKRRSEAVIRYLSGKGVAQSRLVGQGYGDTQPVASNESEEGRSQNRRTECKIL